MCVYTFKTLERVCVIWTAFVKEGTKARHALLESVPPLRLELCHVRWHILALQHLRKIESLLQQSVAATAL